jgi:hypothetical protein
LLPEDVLRGMPYLVGGGIYVVGRVRANQEFKLVPNPRLVERVVQLADPGGKPKKSDSLIF